MKNDDFQQALYDLRKAEDALSQCTSSFEAMAIESTFEEALKSAYRKAKPKAKFNREKAFKVLGPKYDEIRAGFQVEADAYLKDFIGARDEAKELANNLAEQVELESSPHWRELHWYSDQMWASSGPQYGKGRALVHVEALEALGVEVRITPLTDGGYNDWVVEVKATELTVEALQRRGLMTPREFLKACWSRALNPRVYRPFLPHGLEQKLGVTWQGRDVEGWNEEAEA